MIGSVGGNDSWDVYNSTIYQCSGTLQGRANVTYVYVDTNTGNFVLAGRYASYSGFHITVSCITLIGHIKPSTDSRCKTWADEGITMGISEWGRNFEHFN